MDSSYAIVGSDLGSDSDHRHPGETATIGGATDSESGWDDRESQGQHETGAKGKIVVVGAGPVGALAAIYAAHRGFEVEVYELRNGNDIIYFLSSMNIYSFLYSNSMFPCAPLMFCDGFVCYFQTTIQSHFQSSQVMNYVQFRLSEPQSNTQ